MDNLVHPHTWRYLSAVMIDMHAVYLPPVQQWRVHACCGVDVRDYFFGFSLTSELGAIVTGLGIMIVFRILHVPLLAGLPSG